MTEQKKEYKIEGRPATIYRVVKNKDNPYVMVDRRPIDNPQLSYKAKGMLTYLLSRPDGWEINMTDLLKHGTDCEAKIRSGLKELKKAGHMRYTVSRNQGRITGWLIEVFEFPNPPDSDFQQVENLQVENQTQVLSKLNRKKKPISNKEGATPASKPATVTPSEVTLYRTVTKKFPPSPNYDDVITFIQAVSKRLNRDCSADDLRPYYKAWTANGWNQFSINWLDYAVRGVLPTLKKSTFVSKAVEKFNQTTDALRRYAEQEGMVIDV